MLKLSIDIKNCFKLLIKTTTTKEVAANKSITFVVVIVVKIKKTVFTKTIEGKETSEGNSPIER